MKKVIIVGAGGHGKVIADIIRLNGDIVYGYLDDKNPEMLPGFPVLGEVDSIRKFALEDYCFFVAIGNNHIRQKIMASYPIDEWYTAIHPSAVIAEDVETGAGVAIMANAVINSGSKIGCGAIINTSSTVDHENVIGNFAHISPGVHLGGTVHIGDRSWVGIGATVINNIDICDDCIIGAGAVVVGDIKENGVYVGIPANKIVSGGSI